jgi:hypothetical protein
VLLIIRRVKNLQKLTFLENKIKIIIEMLSSNLFIIGRKCRISTLKTINSAPSEEGSPFKSRDVSMPD